MDDLISRNAAIVQACKQIKDDYLAFDVKEAIKNIPSAVVRCKECIWCKDKEENGWWWCLCSNLGIGMPLDGFCSYGERIDDG